MMKGYTTITHHHHESNFNDDRSIDKKVYSPTDEDDDNLGKTPLPIAPYDRRTDRTELIHSPSSYDMNGRRTEGLPMKASERSRNL